MSIKAIKVLGQGTVKSSLSRKSKNHINLNRNMDENSNDVELEPFSGLSKFNVGQGINLQKERVETYNDLITNKIKIDANGDIAGRSRSGVGRRKLVEKKRKHHG